MEPVTHVLVSVAAGRTLGAAGLNKTSSMTTPMLVVSGLLADVDWVSRLGSAEIFLRSHRTATHSLLGTVAIAIFVSLVFMAVAHVWGANNFRLRGALLICGLGAALHVLLDLCNAYGVKLLWPINNKWFAWDIADSVDGWVILVLMSGLLLPELFRLVLQEIGSKPGQQDRRRGAAVSILITLFFLAGRAVAHQGAVAEIESRKYRAETPTKTAAYPHPGNPLAWSGVVETDNTLATLEVSLLPGTPFDPDTANIYFKPEDSETLKTAAATGAARQFLNYARFPLARVEPLDDGFEVRLRDLRFASELPGRRGINAVIDLNAQGQVTRQQLEYDNVHARR